MNAIEFLVAEHEKVRKKLSDIRVASHHYATKKQMFEALSEDLIRHEAMEQKVWYPYFKNNEQLRDIVKHLLAEEKDAHIEINALNKIKIEEDWNEKFKKVKESILHHAKEEESKLFPKVKKILDEAELEIIGKELREFKENFYA
ncbi:MAG: hemerythrin domain-containing protein [Gammaproteobacteria bacterium]|nr:hemerythrin domain-containing protein [Gammaproteobacteria bacterium]